MHISNTTSKVEFKTQSKKQKCAPWQLLSVSPQQSLPQGPTTWSYLPRIRPIPRQVETRQYPLKPLCFILLSPYQLRYWLCQLIAYHARVNLDLLYLLYSPWYLQRKVKTSLPRKDTTSLPRNLRNAWLKVTRTGPANVVQVLTWEKKLLGSLMEIRELLFRFLFSFHLF